jgi:hypothetical protein
LTESEEINSFKIKKSDLSKNYKYIFWVPIRFDKNDTIHSMRMKLVTKVDEYEERKRRERDNEYYNIINPPLYNNEPPAHPAPGYGFLSPRYSSPPRYNSPPLIHSASAPGTSESGSVDEDGLPRRSLSRRSLSRRMSSSEPERWVVEGGKKKQRKTRKNNRKTKKSKKSKRKATRRL